MVEGDGSPLLVELSADRDVNACEGILGSNPPDQKADSCSKSRHLVRHASANTMPERAGSIRRCGFCHSRSITVSGPKIAA